jgi:hypothetical protein
MTVKLKLLTTANGKNGSFRPALDIQKEKFQKENNICSISGTILKQAELLIGHLWIH